LPSKCLPTNYNIKAYDGAILWYKGLHDPVQQGDLDMCISCHHELVTFCKQPLDSLANFQYYGHEALPVEIQNAFDQATTFNIMMVAEACMLLPFNPWRNIRRLKNGHESFGAAFAGFEQAMSDEVRERIDHIQSYHQCGWGGGWRVYLRGITGSMIRDLVCTFENARLFLMWE
jgi:hypothetical protein